MVITIGDKAVRFYSLIEKDLDKAVKENDHLYIVNVLRAELGSMDFDQLCYTESLYRQIKKAPIKGMGPVSQVELAVKLAKFIIYYDPMEEYTREQPKRYRG